MSINSNSTNIQLDIKRHSFAHLMAAAVGQMFPEAQYGVGPVIENGCYYDFVLPRNLIPEDLPLIENHIKDLLKRDLRFKVQELSLEDAIAHFSNAKQPLKVELLENLRDRGTTSMSEEEKADFGGVSIETKLADLLLESKNTGKQLFVDCIIFNEKGEVFVQKRSMNRKKFPGNWELVGGGVEESETFEMAAKREIKEELNFDLVEIVNCLEPFDSILSESMSKENENRNCRSVQLIVKVKDTSNPILEVGKADEFNWINDSNIDILHNNGDLFIQNKVFEALQSYKKYDLILQKITIYRIVDEKTGEVIFEDLCKGPHVWGVRINQESVKDLNLQNMGFKLDKFSASYWRGDQERGINMQRLYALVFETKDELKEFINQREEAKKRDHRVLGQQMKLFTISEMVGAGLTLMQPKGTIIRNLLQQYLWQIHKPHGYQQLWTPHIAKEDLYIRSGHAGHYMDDMFSVYGGTSKEKFYLKPMNCPHHMQVFDDNQFSYKDMPVRYFEPATVYRDEKTGQLSGLARVRNITQDDGHVFCRIGGIQEEVTIFANAVKQFYATMGMEADWVSLSVRDSVDRSKYLGTDENWDIAEKALEDAAIANGFNYKRVEGEAAFYGPKLDFMFKDCLGRQWQLSTIQCDFNLPQRFDLSFKNEDGEQERPVVLHRAVAGSYERFMGIMIENYAGKFPFWLAPEQIRILTINDEVLPFVDKIKAELDKVVLMQPLKYNEIRYSVDTRMESLGKKIRDSKLDKIPMFIVVGMKDVEEGIVSIEYAGESFKVPLGEVKAWMENIK